MFFHAFRTVCIVAQTYVVVGLVFVSICASFHLVQAFPFGSVYNLHQNEIRHAIIIMSIQTWNSVNKIISLLIELVHSFPKSQAIS